MKAFAQPLTGIVRAGPDTDQYGKPWDYAVTYSACDMDTCTVMALKGDGGVTLAHYRALVAELRRIGFRHVRWERKKATGDREIESELT